MSVATRERPEPWDSRSSCGEKAATPGSTLDAIVRLVLLGVALWWIYTQRDYYRALLPVQLSAFTVEQALRALVPLWCVKYIVTGRL